MKKMRTRSRSKVIEKKDSLSSGSKLESASFDALTQQREDFLRALQLRLRTPVRANRVTLSHLLGGEYGELTGEQRSVLHLLSQNNLEIERLLTMLVTLYRFQNGKAELRKERCVFPDLVEPVIEELTQKALQRGITIRKSCRSHNPLIECDFVELQRLVQHLLDNAVKHAKSTVNIECEIRSGHLYVRVEDDGPGIPQKDIENLFNRFYYVSTNGSYSATTGVGLCLCAEIARAHGGSISCQSEPGAYTRFELKLPCDSSPAPS